MNWPAATLAACSSADRLPTGVGALSSGVSNTQAPGWVAACKWQGEPGTYSFNVSVTGSGGHTLPAGTTASVNFDGSNGACVTMYQSIDDGSWTAGVTNQVTITENVPDGMGVLSIIVHNGITGSQSTVTGQNYATVTVDMFNIYRIKFLNGDIPEVPVVGASCVSITATKGVAIAPVQLTATGGEGGPYTFTATGLPAGLTLSTSGVLSGTPTVTGQFTYTVTATDVAGNTGSSSCGVTVKEIPPPPPTGTQGCTPGYWKAKQHWDSWAGTGYTTTQLVSSVFDVPAGLNSEKKGLPLGGYSLVAGLGFQGGNTLGGKAEILLRAAIAGLLNSSNDNVDYFYTTAALISSVNAALNSGDGAAMIALASRIDTENNKGCPLN
jgi:hypothetical protein